MKGLDSAFQSSALWATLAPLLGLGANVLTQIVISRLPLSIGPVRRQFVSFGIGLATAACWLGYTLQSANLSSSDTLAHAVLHMMSYGMVGFIFFNIINLNISSLRIRMLKEYLRVHPHPLPDHVLREKYHTRGMLDARLERLLQGGQITLRNGRYYFKQSPVAFIGRFFAFLQYFLLRK